MTDGEIKCIIFHRLPVAPAAAGLAPSSADPNTPVTSASTNPKIPAPPPFSTHLTQKIKDMFEYMTSESKLP